MEIEVRYRCHRKGLPPQPIKLKIPGWAGDNHDHSNGAKPQPWHCTPFVDGSTYGLELLYQFSNPCRVVNEDGNIRFDGKYSKEEEDLGLQWPPFQMFAPGHYGFTSSLDIVGPPDHIIRIESHPRYYTDLTNSVPCVVPGHIQTEWWPRIFFLAFKAPPAGGIHEFRPMTPYAQILVLPRKVSYDIMPMELAEVEKRNYLDKLILLLEHKIANNVWTDNVGNTFNDKYKVLSRHFQQGGLPAVQKFLEDTYATLQNQKNQTNTVNTDRGSDLSTSQTENTA